MNFINRVIRAAKRIIRTSTGYAWRFFHAPELPKGEKVLVNLGCGEYSGSGFINVDVRGLPNIHYIHDIRDLPMFASGSVDLLYACHVLEHIPRSQLQDVLKEWHRVLKSGGIFRFSVPDFDVLSAVYRSSGNKIDSIVNQLMGQDPLYDSHYSIWNEIYARELLKDLEFVNIRRWDPPTAQFHDFVDKSSRAMQVEGKMLPISLNLEAERR